MLNVYTERPNAFVGQERRVLGQLGEVVGHDIAAVERKRALMSDEVVELAFHVPDVFATLGIEAGTEGTIALAETVSLQDGEYLVYGSATPDAVGSVRALAEEASYWRDVSIRDDGDGATFEAHLSEPPIISMLASLGGVIEEAVVRDGDYRLTLHVPPGTDVRRIIDAVTDAYPPAEMMTRRQVTRDDDAPTGMERMLAETLTDRQRASLLAAYHAGFFAWPRDATGEDVAASLGVSPPTFHQHLRKAEQRVFDSLL